MTGVRAWGVVLNDGKYDLTKKELSRGFEFWYTFLKDKRWFRIKDQQTLSDWYILHHE